MLLAKARWLGANPGPWLLPKLRSSGLGAQDSGVCAQSSAQRFGAWLSGLGLGLRTGECCYLVRGFVRVSGL